MLWSEKFGGSDWMKWVSETLDEWVPICALGMRFRFRNLPLVVLAYLSQSDPEVYRGLWRARRVQTV